MVILEKRTLSESDKKIENWFTNEGAIAISVRYVFNKNSVNYRGLFLCGGGPKNPNAPNGVSPKIRTIFS